MQLMHESPHRFYSATADGLVHIMDSVPHLNISMCYAVKLEYTKPADVGGPVTCLPCLAAFWRFERMLREAFAEGKKGYAF